MTPEAIRHISTVDTKLAEVIKRVGPCDLKPRRLDPFRSLVSAVVYQQLSGKAAATILGRVVALYPGKKFPTPEDLMATSVPTLRAAGLSNAKAAYVRNIAEATLGGTIAPLKQCDKLSDEELIERFTGIKGVGRWTVEMFLIFNLGRQDVLPVHDLGVRKGFQIAYGKRKMPEPKKLAKLGEKWLPHRTTAAWYLWRATDMVG